jgi:excisionase family DNA binding protein
MPREELVSITEQIVEYGRIPEACRRYGLSRSRLYLLAGEGLIRFVKVGNATLVDLGTVRAYLASCPSASVRPPKAA